MTIIEVIYSICGVVKTEFTTDKEAYEIWLENWQPEIDAGDFEILEIIESEL
jgi:hypothetical protein